MTKLTLTNHVQGNMTLLENEFIDKYMADANGEHVKVYLLLLRHLNNPAVSLDITKIADMLDLTEKAVIRALNYWKKVGLLDYETHESLNNQAPISSATTNGTAIPSAITNDTVIPTGAGKGAEKPIANITSLKNRKELKQLLFVAEQYLGKILTSTDVNAITYFYDELGMSVDLVEYLIEYCVENGHKSIHYIQKVALSWVDQGLTTVQEAKANTVLYNKNCYAVLNAYGIKGRAPAKSETEYIRRWNEEYGLSLELIVEACNRTMKNIHQPNFEYTDSILKNWISKGVKHKKDIDVLDLAYRTEKEARKRSDSAEKKPSKDNKFNNFEGRTYDDMDELARKLIQTQ